MGAAGPGAKRRRRAAKRRHAKTKRAWDHWSQVSGAEAAHYYDLIHRVLRDRPNDPAVSDLIYVGGFVRELWRALDRGEIVDDRARTLYRAATGRRDITEAQRLVVAAIQQVAQHTNVPTATNAQITKHVCLQIHRMKGVAERLKEHPVEVAIAVRKWRQGRGRPRLGQPTGSKWFAVAEVLRLAELGNLDEKAIEQLWKVHGFKIE